MTSLEIQHSKCRKLTFANVTNCYLCRSEEFVDFEVIFAVQICC